MFNNIHQYEKFNFNPILIISITGLIAQKNKFTTELNASILGYSKGKSLDILTFDNRYEGIKGTP